MRISSGWCGGMQLASPEGETTRPTASRIREAVLNSVQPYLQGARVLDLFAGSGAVGIEAISRGAGGCVFVERDKRALAALKKNVTELQRRAAKQGMAVDPLLVVADDVDAALPRLAKQAHRFDLVWADPPYNDTMRYLPRLLSVAGQLMVPGGLLVIESGAELAATSLSGWRIEKSRTYGDTMITYLKVDA